MDRMTKPLRALAAAAVSVAAALVAPTPQARAASACSATPAATGSVTIATPSPGQAVSGVVKVTGSASAVAPLSQVELFAGSSLVASASYSPQRRLSFALSWDASRAPVGPTRLRVLACGGNIAGVMADRGSGEVTVEVVAPPPPTTARPGSTTSTSSVAGGAGGPTTTGSRGGTTVPVSTTRVPAVTTTRRKAAAVAGGRQDEGGSRSRGGGDRPVTPGRLLLTPGQEDTPGPPLWVGAVVGLPGVAGLLLSARRHWRRPRPVVEPDGRGLFEVT